MTTINKAENLTIKQRVRRIIFEAETPLGKAFDISLIVLILISVATVMLESVESIHSRFGGLLSVVEWTCTILFTLEYIARAWTSRMTWKYIFSFYGLVDLLSCLPTYLMLLPGIDGGSSIRVIRILRLLRMFRIFKMVQHVRGANVILRGLLLSRAKITVFFFAVLLLAVIAGTVLYLAESGSNAKFSSIPESIYFAIVSITTVGYGDVTTVTPLGKFLTTILILTGYAIIAVPTGIVSAEMARAQDETTDACPSCGVHGHLEDANYCRKCGDSLED